MVKSGFLSGPEAGADLGGGERRHRNGRTGFLPLMSGLAAGIAGGFMRIGILTGGGDVPGLNACIKAVVRRAGELGWAVVGFRRGWAGVLDYDLADEAASAERCLMALDRPTVRTVDNKGGTILHTSRVHPGKIKPENLPDHLKGKLAPAAGLQTVDC